MNKPTAFCSAIALAALLSSCAGTVPRERYYRLSDPEPARSLAVSVEAAILEVDRFQARELLQAERHLLQQLEGGGIDRLPGALWIEPPAQMVQRALQYYLGALDTFDHVVGQAKQVGARYRLSGILLALERVADKTHVNLTLGLTVVDLRERTVVLDQRYALSEPADDDTIPAAVTAFDRALARLAGLFAADLGHALGQGR